MAVVFMDKKVNVRQGSKETEITGIEEVDVFEDTSILVDKYVEATTKLAQLQVDCAPFVDALSKIKAELIHRVADLAATEEQILKSVDHAVKIGKEGNIITVAAYDTVRAALDKETFKAVVKFGVGDLKKYCSAAQLNKIITVGRAGNRSIKVIS